jgi:hypothetical protein
VLLECRALSSTPAHRAPSVFTAPSDLGVDRGYDFDLQGPETLHVDRDHGNLCATCWHEPYEICSWELRPRTFAPYRSLCTSEAPNPPDKAHPTTRWSRLKGDRHLRKDAGRQVRSRARHRFQCNAISVWIMYNGAWDIRWLTRGNTYRYIGLALAVTGTLAIGKDFYPLGLLS